MTKRAALFSTTPLARRVFLVLVVSGVGIAVAQVARALQQRDEFTDSPFLRVDPDRVLMTSGDIRPCGECHTSEFAAWQGTSHATGFANMHKTESAVDILREMELRTAKRREALCMRCHYTVSPELKAVAGVSCESCHGPARDWMPIHNDYGDGIDHPDNESEAHRVSRVSQAEAAGMFRPSGDLYAVAANCFECHTVPFEDLVNTGGHKSGSGAFDLVERVEQIRHNFVHEQWRGEPGNRETSAERKRMMYVIGRILSYEFGLRGMAVATEESRYSKSVERRIKTALEQLDGLSRTTDIPEVTEVLALRFGLPMAPDNREALLAAADQVRVLGQQFTRTNDGIGLEAVDLLIAGEAPPAPIAADPSPPTTGAADTPPTAGSAARADAGATSSAIAATPVGQPAPAATPTLAIALPELPGEIRPRPDWFTVPEAETILPGDCVDCHAQAEEWYFDDAHESAQFRLLNKDPKAVEIATLYGLTADEMSLGNQICMNCHGTIPSGAPNVTVLNGVSCESCHGGAGDYYDPHKDGGNPQLGMRNLKDATARATNCSRCHRVTDDRLLAAGHPSGEGYDFVTANQEIEHYPDRRLSRRRDGDYPTLDGAVLAAAYRVITASRAIPTVTVASLPRPVPFTAIPSTTATAAVVPGAGPGSTPARTAPAVSLPFGATTGVPPTVVEPARRPVTQEEVTSRGETPVRSVPPTPPPVLPPSVTPNATPVLAALLEEISVDTEGLTTEDLLLLVKQRLDRLYQLLGNGS